MAKWTMDDIQQLAGKGKVKISADTGLRVDAPVIRSTVRGRNQSTWSEDLTIRALVAAGLPEPVTEHKFHSSRKWRLDIAWPHHRIGLEVEGGVYTGGAHGSVSGILRDIEKYNAATVLDWHILRALPSSLPGTQLDGDLLRQLESLFKLRSWI